LASPIYNNLNNVNSNLSNDINYPNKNNSYNSLNNLLKSRSKNLSINCNNNIASNLNIAASGSSPGLINVISNNNNSSSVVLNMKQSSATPYKNPNTNEKLPFIEQKVLNSRQFSSNISLHKKILQSPSIKNGVLNLNNQPKSGTKYTTLGANSTGNSTLSINFLHKRSGSTNTNNNY
jgi:hypothetical protein